MKRTWLPFLLLLAAEFLLFDRMTSRHLAWAYPRWDDQLEPLTEAYTGYEFRQAHGLGAGLGHALAEPAAQGDLHAFWALLAFEAAGRPSRSAALAVNMLAFIAWQAVLAAALWRRTRSPALIWTAIGLTLALGRPWLDLQGSATDFRLDHAAMCLMGMAAAAALLAEGFRSARGSALLGLAVGLTLIARFLTVTYFAVSLAACAGWILLGSGRRRRLLHLGLAAGVAGAAAFPCFWANRQAVFVHYWIGHYGGSGDAAIWDLHRPLARTAGLFWSHLALEQLGPAFWLAAGTALALALAGSGRAAGRARQNLPGLPAELAILGAIFLAGPAVVLPLQNQDFFAVLGIAVPGALLLVLAALAALRERARPGSWLPAGAAAAAFAAGAWHFTARQLAEPFAPAAAADARQVNVLADRIVLAAAAAHLERPTLAVDEVLDFANAPVFRVLGYERHRIWIWLGSTLPTGLGAISAADLSGQLAASDFVIATEAGPAGPFPFDQEMAELRPQTLTWCRAHLRELGGATIAGRRLILFERRGLPPP